MIIKALGMITVFLSSSLIGICFAECLASRERELNNLSDAVELMMGELGYTMAPLKDIIALVTPRTRGMCKDMLESVVFMIEEGELSSEAWRKAVMKHSPSMSFTKSDALSLASRDYLFTAYEAEEQLKHLSELKAVITSLASQAGEVKRKNSKMLRMLGVYGGALLCVIML